MNLAMLKRKNTWNFWTPQPEPATIFEACDSPHPSDLSHIPIWVISYYII